MNRVAIVVLAALALAGCGARYQAVRECQKEAGDQPFQSANAFGLAGGLWAAGQPEMQAWGARVDACYKQRVTQS